RRPAAASNAPSRERGKPAATSSRADRKLRIANAAPAVRAGTEAKPQPQAESKKRTKPPAMPGPAHAATGFDHMPAFLRRPVRTA
ncbi:MAG TPA: hypothetical protein VNK52_03795, partial [Hyphomicrobiaceae bacterium]|nr:hypothetical protein [Hyphomicrobiaceae bacterium]